MLPTSNKDFNRVSTSSISNGFLSKIVNTIRGWIKKIMNDKNSRNLLMFLLLNFSFAFIELFYGIWTNSLGLISDSFHMFFDCTGLLAGLAANIIIQWKANEHYSYGYERAEVLAGLSQIFGSAKEYSVMIFLWFQALLMVSSCFSFPFSSSLKLLRELLNLQK